MTSIVFVIEAAIDNLKWEQIFYDQVSHCVRTYGINSIISALFHLIE